MRSQREDKFEEKESSDDAPKNVDWKLVRAEKYPKAHKG